MTEKEPITGEVFVPTPAFTSSTLDDDEARETFIEDHKLTKAQIETVTMVSKQHDIGHGIRYVFMAEAK